MSRPGWLVAAALSAALTARAEPVTMHQLPDGSIITVERYFDSDEYSELHGWRERLLIDRLAPKTSRTTARDAGSARGEHVC